MKQIFKYNLPVMDSTFILELPKNAEFLDAQSQGQTGVAWFLVDSSNENVPRAFKIIFTGKEIFSTTGLFYLKTIQLMGGILVCHLFEIENN